MRQNAVAFKWHVPGNPFPIGAAQVSAPRHSPRPGSDILLEREATHKLVRRMLKARRARADFFGAELFADPAWDILLELHASNLAHRRMSVTDVCNASDVPATTALRWIRTLERGGLLQRRQDPHDGRRTFIELTETASGSISSYFRTVANAHAAI